MDRMRTQVYASATCAPVLAVASSLVLDLRNSLPLPIVTELPRGMKAIPVYARFVPAVADVPH